MQPATLPAGSRPTTVTGGLPAHVGRYSWFVTLSPARNELTLPVAQRRTYTVSVVVCENREFGVESGGDPEGEHTPANPVTFVGGIGLGGGTIPLSGAGSEIEMVTHLKLNQWVLLVGMDASGAVPEVGHWYRVVGLGDLNTPYISLVGPDWDTATYGQPGASRTRLIGVHGVTGVYTAVVRLDDDLIWGR